MAGVCVGVGGGHLIYIISHYRYVSIQSVFWRRRFRAEFGFVCFAIISPRKRELVASTFGFLLSCGGECVSSSCWLELVCSLYMWPFLVNSHLLKSFGCVVSYEWFTLNTLNDPAHEISKIAVCATGKVSDQSAHTRSLIRAFASRLDIIGVLSY